MGHDAKALWDANRGYDAGLLIADDIPLALQPKWAANILRLVKSQTGVDHQKLNRVLQVADDAVQWRTAHDVFSEVRAVSLKLDEKERRGLSEDEQMLSWILVLAELVAKVTYNATAPSDEFDEDSSAWIVASLRGFVEVSGDEEFAKAAWSMATNP